MVIAPSLQLLVFVVGDVLLLVAGIGVPDQPRIKWGWLGAFLIAASMLIKI
jgi:hypothetical protein